MQSLPAKLTHALYIFNDVRQFIGVLFIAAVENTMQRFFLNDLVHHLSASRKKRIYEIIISVTAHKYCHSLHLLELHFLSDSKGISSSEGHVL